jgi:hypothetical protein
MKTEEAIKEIHMMGRLWPINTDPIVEVIQELDSRNDELVTLCREIISTFTKKGSLGGIDDSLQSEWIKVDQVTEWKRILEGNHAETE